MVLCASISLIDGQEKVDPAAIAFAGLCSLERRCSMTLLAADIAEKVAKECL